MNFSSKKYASLSVLQKPDKKVDYYNNVLKSHDNFFEKQKLQEENWRLKQILQSTADQNKSLKEKLKSNPEKHPVNLKIISQSENSDKIEENIAQVQSDINKITNENMELRKKLAKVSEKSLKKSKTWKKFEIRISKIDFPSEYDDQASKTQQIHILEKEIKTLSEELTKLHNKNLSLEDQIESTAIEIEILGEKRAQNSCFSIKNELNLCIFPF